jgi:NADH-quinone oxidoreductase subunit D
MPITQEQDKFIVPIGPQHPALKEPGHFEFSVEGEIVTSATARLGYAHRGIEKATEGRNWVQNLYILERICGICSHTHGMNYSIGVEKLAGVVAPPRAQAIRVLVAELERVHSHMLWWGVAAHEGGFDTLFMYSWRDREIVLNILEDLCGNRVNYSANILGGVKVDVSAEQAKRILEGIDKLEERTHYYMKIMEEDETFRARTENIGVMSKEEAEILGAVGPTARASGVLRDVRIDSPYLGYEKYKLEPITATAGDLKARFLVRVRELFDSYRIIRDIIANLPEGELSVRFPRKIPAGNVISRVEAPRGECFYYIESNGSDKPERIKVRTPTLPNWGSVLATAVGHKLADMPMILVGIDPCFSCNDRGVMMSKDGNDPQSWTWDDLRRYGIEYYK